MLPKQYRLTTKDINYILKRRQVIYTPDFVFFWVPQYRNLTYNQFAIQLSTKVHKRSVKRNKVKRMYYDVIQAKHLLTSQSVSGYKRLIALPHKKDVENRHQLLDTKQRDNIRSKLELSLSKL
jgi:ribonuclease P protein component